MEIEGKLYSKSEAKRINDKLTKREFVVEYAENPMYPEYIQFDLMNDKCALVDGFQKGDGMKVSFNLRGRRWTNQEGMEMVFNSLHAWRVQKANLESKNAEPNAEKAASVQMSDIDFASEPDLPF